MRVRALKYPHRRLRTLPHGMQAKAASVTEKETRKDILLLAELAEATGGVGLETVGQAENLMVLTPEQREAT